MSVDPSHLGLDQAWGRLLESGLVNRPPEPPGLGADPWVGWAPVTMLERSATWAALAGAYSDHLGTPHHAVGAACALQHYAGKLAVAIFGLWAQTGSIADLTSSRWRVLLDESARTQSVSGDLRVATVNTSLQEAISSVRQHMEPMVHGAQMAGSITARLAWGSVATSCAGALARVQRALPTTAAELLGAEVIAELDGVTWGTGRALVTCHMLPSAHGARLVHERHTCCLIRLGREGSVCATCPQQSAAARRVHQADVVAIPNARRTLIAGFTT